MSALGNVMPIPQIQFCDTNGAPYALGTLTFYAAGTTTPQDTYSNADLNIAHVNSNPLALDAAGRAIVYFQPLGYRVILKDSGGNTIWDQDKVYGIDINNLIGSQTANTIFAGPSSGSAAAPTFRALVGADVGNNAFNQFRLTLTSGTPVTTADVTAATTIYCAPFGGNRISLYDGSVWNIRTSAQFSIAVPASTSQMYDIFCYDNSGTPTLELLAWTNDTTRATALTTQDGIYVKTGATTRRYIGSVRTTGVSGQTEDSFAKRYLWNYYNRVPRIGRVLESTTNWTYTTATYRQANGAAGNQLDFVIGVAEVELSAIIVVGFSNSSAGVGAGVAVGEDSTTTPATGCVMNRAYENVLGDTVTAQATLRTYPAVGRHYYPWLEASQATGTTTWEGKITGPPTVQAGISGELSGG